MYTITIVSWRTKLCNVDGNASHASGPATVKDLSDLVWSAGASAEQWSLRGPQSGDDCFNQSMHLFSEQAHSTEIETTGVDVPVICRESKK